jgi:nucleotide-binding universal stress UspA family protein
MGEAVCERRPTMNPIILATDGSPSAADATRRAVELARATDAKLIVVSVWHAGLTTYSSAALPESKRTAKEQACEAARAAVEVARTAGLGAESFVLEGDAVERICASAADTGASLVVVGSHGFGPVHSLVFGSVSTALLHHAPCPVLVVRPLAEAA